MPNTASTATVVDHTSDAGFRTWVAEVIAQILVVGITQTADTGQINTGTVTRPGVNTAGGYVILRFNDTAHATTPIFMKLEFGTGASATGPAMWITVGSGSNGSGTITGTTMTRVICGSSIPLSTITPYTSRFIYNPTYGYFGVIWKIAGVSSTQNIAGFVIFRSTDAAGAATTDSVMLITNSTSATVSGTGSAFMLFFSHLTSTAYNTTNPILLGSSFSAWPFTATATIYSGNGQVGFIYQLTPVIGISALSGCALLTEIGNGSTVVLALVGATTHTFLAVGGGFGQTSGISQTTVGFLMLWE